MKKTDKKDKTVYKQCQFKRNEKQNKRTEKNIY